MTAQNTGPHLHLEFNKGGTISPGTLVQAGERIGQVIDSDGRVACHYVPMLGPYEPLPIYEAAWEAAYGDLIDDEIASNYGQFVEVGKPEGYVDAVLAAVNEEERAEAAHRDAPSPSTRFAWAVGGFVGILAIVLLILAALGWD